MNLRKLAILPAAVAVLVAPVAAAESAVAKTKYPSIKKITPMNLAIGETMSVSGRNFTPGAGKTTIVFKRKKQRAIFAKAVSATRRKVKVVVPEKLRTFMVTREGEAIPTKFRIRVLARRFGKRYTPRTASPVIAPASATPAGPSKPDPLADCDSDGIPNHLDLDDDNDHLSDEFERTIGTDPCKWDTDGDGLSDYWEYQSALDLNLRALPYPGKRPYPNPLFADADVDYDGDGMRAWQEHAMWVRYGNAAPVLNYSDGTQRSDPASGLTDDRRDVDGDGLANWWEANGPGQHAWWTAMYPDEKPYEVVYGDLDFLDPDTDGDGRLDGDDDLDHDGYTNAEELSRHAPLPDKFDASVEPRPRWVQMFNPCLPDPESITCSLHPPLPISESYPPFDKLGFPAVFDEDHPRPLPWPNAPVVKP